jgi:hypothetical protein
MSRKSCSSEAARSYTTKVQIPAHKISLCYLDFATGMQSESNSPQLRDSGMDCARWGLSRGVLHKVVRRTKQ